MAGRTRLFTEDDIAAIIESLPSPKASTSAASHTIAEPSTASKWARLQKLLAEDRRKRSKRNVRLGKTGAGDVE
jgi:hypothetical protein